VHQTKFSIFIDIFKLAQGEYIRPEYIENVYKQSKFVGHIFVYGDSFQQYLVAIVVPSFEALIPWAKSKGLPESPAELIKLPQVSQMILEDMRVQANRENLRGFEEVKKISLHLQEFTVENDMLTPSLKLKRHQAKLKFQTEISKMYGSSSKL
jgi:long-chain acyl-CoA synthetase